MALNDFLARMTAAHYNQCGMLPVQDEISNWIQFYKDKLCLNR